MNQLHEKVALVTGGGRGLGRAMALALAQAGASVTITARSLEQLQETAMLLEQVGTGVLAVAGDVSDPLSVERVVQQTAQTFGPIDILVNNAGSLTSMGNVWETDPHQWWRDMEINVRGPYLYAHAVLPGMLMRKRGCIINVVSRSGTVAQPAQSAYSVSKTALIRLTETLALETKEAGISVFAIHPGTIPTAMSLHMAAFRDRNPQEGAAFRALLTDVPEQPANLVVFLATGQADALTGRYISAREDIAYLCQHADQIQQNDLYALRINTLK